MVDYQEIIRLKSTKPKTSNSMIVSSSGSTRSTVAEVWKLVQEKRLSQPAPTVLANQIWNRSFIVNVSTGKGGLCRIMNTFIMNSRSPKPLMQNLFGAQSFRILEANSGKSFGMTSVYDVREEKFIDKELLWLPALYQRYKKGESTAYFQTVACNQAIPECRESE